MGFLENIFGSRKKEAPEQLANFLQLFGFVNPYFVTVDNAREALENGYLANADVFSIIELITMTAAQVEWKLYEVVDEKKYSRQKDFSDYALALRKIDKSFVETSNDIISAMLKTPNNLQTWSEFIQQIMGFKLITGNAYVQGVAPVGRKYFRELWVLPSQNIGIVPGRGERLVEGYNLGALKNFIPKAEVMHVRHWTPRYENGQMLYGLSPLQAAYRVLTLSNENDIANIRSIQNIGAVGILSNDGTPLINNPSGESAFKKLQDVWETKFSGSANRGKVLATTANVKWQQIGLSPVDMNIIQSQNMNMRRLCNIYGVPSQLLNDPENKTYNNQSEAEKALLSRVVLPTLINLRDELNAFFVEPIAKQTGKKLYLDLDTSAIPVLQPNLELLSKRLIREKNAGIWTPNEVRVMLGGDEVDTPEMNQFTTLQSQRENE